mmetsp:Transcript_36835/g.85113  ORF Transcript_36835/g.85113 Transcript_36835/m.85113 type:complete len:244 (-) Transcript_36835:294-1025(-)
MCIKYMHLLHDTVKRLLLRAIGIPIKLVDGHVVNEEPGQTGGPMCIHQDSLLVAQRIGMLPRFPNMTYADYPMFRHVTEPLLKLCFGHESIVWHFLASRPHLPLLVKLVKILTANQSNAPILIDQKLAQDLRAGEVRLLPLVQRHVRVRHRASSALVLDTRTVACSIEAILDVVLCQLVCHLACHLIVHGLVSSRASIRRLLSVSTTATGDHQGNDKPPQHAANHYERSPPPCRLHRVLALRN